MNRYKLESLIASDLEDAAQWARKNGDDFTRDDIENVFNETLDSALIYTRDIYALWDDFGNPEPWGMQGTIQASILSAVFEAILESDILLNAAIEADLDSILEA